MGVGGKAISVLNMRKGLEIGSGGVFFGYTSFNWDLNMTYCLSCLSRCC